MKTNGLLKWLVIPVVLLVLFIAIKGMSGKEEQNNLNDTPRLTAEEMKALGIEGDSPRDTLATLVGQIKQLRQELLDTQASYQQLRSDNERLRARESGMDQKIDAALSTERERLRQESERYAADRVQTQNMFSELQRRLEGASEHIELPVGLGLNHNEQPVPESLQWVEPLDIKPQQNNRSTSTQGTSSFATSFSAGNSAENGLLDHSAHAGERIRHQNFEDKADTKAPVYTIPANSTLMGSVAMTALIGRVPVDGTVNDPYPFKILVGTDNLTANGIDLPDVAGAVISGSASGDWTLSCVRGQIHSMTFVFNDGTVRTVPKPSTGESGSNNNRNTTHGVMGGGLGWISDAHGIPCVSGERRSNASEYIGNQSLITAAGAGVAYLLRDTQNSNYSNGGDVTTGMDAVGQILQGGVKDVSSWMNKLYGQAFASVYVQPGAPVVVHLEQQLDIDYDSEGRKVDYRNVGGSHVRALD